MRKPPLPRDLDRPLLREAADALQQGGEILAVDVFHREKRSAVGVANVVRAADVAVRDRAGDADLVMELREARTAPSRRATNRAARPERSSRPAGACRRPRR